MYDDHQVLLEVLEQEGKLHRVAAAVDKDWELACISRWSFDAAMPKQRRPILFESVEGHDAAVSVGLYGSVELYAFALGTQPQELYSRWAQAIENPLTPQHVDHGPIHEVVHTGKDVDLYALPIPVWTPGRDTRPYISSAGVVTKDPETGIANMGVYRAQLQGRDRLGMFFGSDKQHGAMHLAKYRRRQEPMPIALVVGGPPAVNFAAAAKTTYGVDEMATAGALAGSPVPVVRAITADLVVPARAEYVIEGTIDPCLVHAEGPFGEAMGYMDEAAVAPRVDVTAITQRCRPVFHGYMQQLPPSEGHLVWEIAALGSLWYYLRHQMRLDWLLDAAVIPGSGGLSGISLQVRRDSQDASARLTEIFSQLNFGQKQVVIVDDDIDIRDHLSLQWAVSTRTDPARDVHLFDGVKTYLRDPAVLHRQRVDGSATPNAPYPSSIMVIDATLKSPAPQVALPTPQYMRAVAERWPDYGLPSLAEPSRLWSLMGES